MGWSWGLRRWDLVPQDCCKPDKSTHGEKMPGGPGVLHVPPPGTIFLLLVSAAGLGMWLTGGYLGEEGGVRRLERGHRQREGLQEPGQRGEQEGSWERPL